MLTSCCTVILTLSIQASDYVLAPKPLQTEVTVGCYYFPGHFSAERWAPMKQYGRPVPMLGYYRDGSPEVSDWHIKWAVESGISFFAFDWYYDYNTGHVSTHNRALDEGFLKAKYRGLMKFCLMWCNEEPKTSPPYTEQNLRLLGRTLGERYFRERNYLRVDGRPVLFVSRPHRVLDSFGKGFRRRCSLVAREAGLARGVEIFWVANTTSRLAECAAAGFGAVSAYNYARAGMPGEWLRSPYDDMVKGYEGVWKQVAAEGRLPYIPPLSPGWDSRPWYGARALVRQGSTPAKFRRMCEMVTPYVDPKLNMVIVECWNEFGEGSYVEPCERFGFGYLNALRDAFGKGSGFPRNVTPTQSQKTRVVWAAVPDEPFTRFVSGTENLVVNPGMEDDWGWIKYDGAQVRFSTSISHSGRRSLEIRPGEGVKPRLPSRVATGRSYDVSAWVCAPRGGRVAVVCSLFDDSARWLRKHVPIGSSVSAAWEKIEAVYDSLDPRAAGIKLEFTVRGGPGFVDDVRVSSRGEPPALKALFADDMEAGTGWLTYAGSSATFDADVCRSGGKSLVCPPGTGVKCAKRISTQQGATYTVEAWIRCEPTATIRIKAAMFGEQGRFLQRYCDLDRLSWQDWFRARGRVRIGEADVDSFNVEFVSLGGRTWIDDVRVETVR